MRASPFERSAPRESGAPKDFLRRRLVAPVTALLAQGLSPDRVALTLAIGIALAAFPIIGMTTFLCTVFALALKLNMPLIQAVNYLGAPLQLACLVPFVRLGARIFGGGEGARFTLPQMISLVSHEPRRAFEVLWLSGLRAVGAWALVAPFAVAALYLVLRPILEKAARRLARAPRAPSAPAT